MLRVIFVLGCLAVGIRYSFRGPFYILLLYLWLAYFRPEQWVWVDFLSAVTPSFVIGVALLAATIFSGQKYPWNGRIMLPFLFLAHGLVSTILSDAQGAAWYYWREFARSIVVSYLMIVLINTTAKLRTVLLIIALSLSLEATKQGWAQMVLNPGARNDNGWVMLGDNNGVAIGMFMLTSIVIALMRTSKTSWERYVGSFVIVGIIYRAISTYSRGGFLSGGALALHYVSRTKHKVLGVAVVAFFCILLSQVLPQSFWDRMSTIGVAAETGEAVDDSTAGRLHFWAVGILMANDRPVFGVGHNAFNNMYDHYDDSAGLYGRGRSPHSIWFGVLGELGYVGLVLFSLMFVVAFLGLRRVRLQAKHDPRLAELEPYSTAIEGALIAAFVGGTVFPFQYNEMLWHMFALTIVLDRLRATLTEAAPAVPPQPALARPVHGVTPAAALGPRRWQPRRSAS